MRLFLGHYYSNKDLWFIVWARNRSEAMWYLDATSGPGDARTFIELRELGYIDFTMKNMEDEDPDSEGVIKYVPKPSGDCEINDVWEDYVAKEINQFMDDPAPELEKPENVVAKQLGIDQHDVLDSYALSHPDIRKKIFNEKIEETKLTKKEQPEIANCDGNYFSELMEFERWPEAPRVIVKTESTIDGELIKKLVEEFMVNYVKLVKAFGIRSDKDELRRSMHYCDELNTYIPGNDGYQESYPELIVVSRAEIDEDKEIVEFLYGEFARKYNEKMKKNQ